MVVHVGRKIRHLFVALELLVGAVAVGQHQHVLVFQMAEVIVDPFLFHQPADKIEVRFPRLHAIFPLAVGAAELVFEVAESDIAKHGLNDVRHRHRF